MKEMYRNYKTEELVLRYQTTQDEALLQEIIVRNKGIMYLTARKYNIPNVELEDIIQELYVACWRAASNYDPSRGCTFSTVLGGFARRQLNRLYNSETRKKRYNGVKNMSYDELDEINKEGGSEGHGYFTVECEDIKAVEFNEFLNSLKLSDKERVVVNMLMNGDTKGEVAKALNCTPATVAYYCNRLRRRIAPFI